MLGILLVLSLLAGWLLLTNSDASGCVTAATSTGCQSGYINISSSVTSVSSSAFNGYSVTGVSFDTCSSLTSLSSYSFANNKIASVVWPSTLKSIDVGAFYSNQLTSVDSSKLGKVATLGSSTSYGVFQNNYITTVDLNFMNLTSIPANCFASNQLHSATLTSKLTSLGQSSFHTNKLTEINFSGTKISSIGAYSFYSNAIKSITWSSSITSLGEGAFKYNYLTSLDMSPLTKLTTVSSSDSHGIFESNYLEEVTFSKSMVLTTIANRMFISNKIRSIDLSPLKLTSIGNYAFYDNAITSITWSSNITSLGIGAFKYNALTSLDMSPLTKLTTVSSSDSHGIFESNYIHTVTFSKSMVESWI
jgi:hypothetical protein